MRYCRILVFALVGLTFVVVGSGCGAQGERRPYANDGEQFRDIRKAEAAFRRGMESVAKDPQDAETWFRRALTLDLYHGPAHNNLGVLLLDQGKFYDAAEEFEWARKLMPGNPEPRTNLAVVLEKVGHTQEALQAAKAAIEISPGNLQAVQTLAYLHIEHGLRDEQTEDLLRTIVFRADDPIWATWARRLLAKKDGVTD